MPGETVEDEAFVSLVTNNSYANGALVLGYSLRRVNTTRKLVLLVAKEVLEPTRYGGSYLRKETTRLLCVNGNFEET